MAEKKQHDKNENDLIRAANLLAEYGYEVIAIRNDEQCNQALTITVFPPGKDTRK